MLLLNTTKNNFFKILSKGTEESFPPSIRAIVENSENLQIGSLILITCSGGIIGRDKTNAVYLPDVCVSKVNGCYLQ